MRKIWMALLMPLALIAMEANAQFIKNATKESAPGWEKLSFETDGVYGAEIARAQELMAGQKVRKTVTVAIIGPGIDVDNPEIKESLWKNRKEKPNGKDDDRNGLADDLHGWNFLGTPDGKTLNQISRAGDREFFRLKDKYGDYLFFNGKWLKADSDSRQIVEVDAPADIAEYNYFRGKVLPESRVGKSRTGHKMAEMVRYMLPVFEAEMRAKFPDKELTKSDFKTLIDRNSTDTLRTMALIMTDYLFMSAESDSWDKMVAYANGPHIEYLAERQRILANNTVKGDREYLGDDPYDLTDRHYGNNNLSGNNAGIGTMQAGVIAEAAPAAKVMTLRVDADPLGEPYMKDVALAIRYAVDKGADIIQLGKSNTFYPEPWSDWVDEALAYAESKGVLVVMQMMDFSYNLDDQAFYPNKRSKSGREFANVITVAASDSHGNPMPTANFSKTGLDLFAPGVGINAPYLGGTRRTESGSNLAASMVSGVAALIKSYYPSIGPEQMRQLLMDNVTSREGAEVEKEYVLFSKGQKFGTTKDLFLFEDLAVSPGIVNAREAIEAAAGIAGSRKK